jgi:retron-type reverse transcriptase
MISSAFAQLCSWGNLVLAWRKAARGKRGTASVARFEYRAEEHLVDLRERLLAGTYCPGSYVHFHIKDPKRRKISAIRFRDRVVHHALCTVIEPRFERLFIADSYANRKTRGTHRAVDRLQQLARRYRYVLRADVVQHFASVDHAILLDILRRRVPEADVMRLVETIVASGRGADDGDEHTTRKPMLLNRLLGSSP